MLCVRYELQRKSEDDNNDAAARRCSVVADFMSIHVDVTQLIKYQKETFKILILQFSASV